MDIRILIADDNIEFAATLAGIVNHFGYKTILAHSPDSALNVLNEHRSEIAVALLDIDFGPDTDLNGLDILETMRKKYPDIPVVMITGEGTIEIAVSATKLGAMNFIEKGVVNKKKIKEVLDSTMERIGPKGESEEIMNFLKSEGIIAVSKRMMEIGDSIIRYARTDLNVLITGATGTGKKLVANAIHNASRRKRHPFVTVDIPNIPHDLFQSELFGHVKGAFSGAVETKKGLFRQADNGTVFLDEIAEMTSDLQSSLFIPIEEKVVRKVGSVRSEPVNIRFISATDKDLITAMKQGKFREQLYHRLRECEIRLPSLEERKEDIPHIVDFYLKKHNNEYNEQKFFAPAALDFVTEQKWHGNVRELNSILKVALQTSLKDRIEAKDISKILENSPSANRPPAETELLSSAGTLKADLAKVDKIKIEESLERCKGNVTKTAGLLGVSRETLHNRIKKYDIDVNQYRKRRPKSK